MVISEDQTDIRSKLKLHIKNVIIGNDTLSLSIYANHYTFQSENYLGKTVTIKGRLILRKKFYQPHIIVGSIIDKNYNLSFTGRLFHITSDYINKIIENSSKSNYAAIAQGLILGGSSRLNRETKMVFARAGVLHILAVSGLHIGFIIIFLGTLFFPIPHRFRFFLIMLFLLFYAGITGFRPSVLRASLMAFLFGLSIILQRQVDAMHIVNMSALVLLLINPFMLFETGAQLSFSAVYGIVYLLPKINTIFLKKIKLKILKPIFWSMATSFSAQVFVSPFLIYYFNQLPVLAVFSNIIIVPLSSIIIYLLFISILLSMIYAPIVNLLSYMINHLISGLEFIAGLFSSIPFSSPKINLPPILLFLFFFIFVKKTQKFAIFGILITSIIISLCSSIPVSSIKVKNNTALITLPNREEILIYKGRHISLPDDFDIEDVDYLIARENFLDVKNFIQLPEDFHYKSLKIDEFVITMDSTITISYYGNKFNIFKDTMDNAVHYIFCGRKGIYHYEESDGTSPLEKIVNDLKGYFWRIKSTI